jgi:hypothetical protein
MNLLHSFGFWEEFYSNRYQRPSIFDDIKNTLVLQEKDKTLLYLKSGLPVAGSRHTVSCPIYKNRIGTQEVFTDGLWFWTIEAIYYVEKHDIVIPTTFIEHIKNNQFICPKIDEDDYALIDPLCEKAFKLM